ncbi:MAG: 16S rRNA (cytosine(967)-C(5))-methyltransferase RsmB [Burkholderiales bacterium]|nr:16S rRNA (cytosine(967)-C(5))-methyltransferase RsmB [Burkholderiales bacterium]
MHPGAPAAGGRRAPARSLSGALALAARVLARVLGGASLDAALDAEHPTPDTLRAAAQDFAYKALRRYGWLQAVLARFLTAPLPDPALRGLLYAGLAELEERPAGAHATVHQAVEAAALLGHPGARGLVNAVLRRFLRESGRLRDEIEGNDEARYRHPRWWIERLRAAYPQEWPALLAQANVRAPMTLRVNLRRTSVEASRARLARSGIGAARIAEQALRLARALPVERLPGFAEGEVSVQDAGAQLAAPLLDVRPGARVLDACAAPGGKTAHLLEIADCSVTAVDLSEARMRRVAQNLRRLGLAAELRVADAARPETFAGDAPFDRILLDAPCTASGVVRRHPDLKWLRRESDIVSLAHSQQRLLAALWRVLAPDGKLLYATCSLFPQENRLQMQGFLEAHPEARSLPIRGLPGGLRMPDADHDGFFYALLQKAR